MPAAFGQLVGSVASPQTGTGALAKEQSLACSPRAWLWHRGLGGRVEPEGPGEATSQTAWPGSPVPAGPGQAARCSLHSLPWGY